MVPAGNKTKGLSLVNHATKAIHHHQFIIICFQSETAKSTREVIVKVERYDHKAILLTEKLNFGETLQNHF